jgi:hypothetical protein
MYIRHLVLVVVLLLTGCGKDPLPSATVEKPPGSAVLVEEPAFLEESAAPEPKPVTAVPKVAVKIRSAPQEQETSVPVDLSLPPELLEGLQLGVPIPQEQAQSLLPPLFVDKPAPERRLQLGGRLLLNEEIKEEPLNSVGGALNSVDGAEVQLEFKR